ncbi:helix-turn-helix transcriptional regulator [Streptomyces sp. NBC_01808]|uniref:helix-turn-helix domain-containing protein n=1 Tax=Streptomyces sp. NBC_01808 TaxID=2975947 RepID=UPI002DD7FD6B|nr:helix-turn-helix transcriptional regulator [Streptomyces sp. NBC_01808]WSA41224.1 helix-turn-helix transcriptional regulator [Streptomyces sp. NBC_01808]
MGKVGNVSLYGGESEAADNLKTFGAMLKVLRDEAGLTQEALAEGLGYSVEHISKIERGGRFPPRDLDKLAEEVLGPLAARLLRETRLSLTRKAGLASRFRHWAVIEKEAVTLYAYECRVVPGLLQPESYIRALFESVLPPLVEEQIEQRVAARLERQAVLDERPNTYFGFIIEQALLERHMGGKEVTRTLLDHLLAMGKRRNIEIQVMPLRAAHHVGSAGSIYLAETVDHKWLGYSEGQRSSNLISNLTDVGILQQRYRKLSSQALSHEATVELLEQMRGDL